MSGTPRRSDEQIAAILEDLQNGMPGSDVAEKHDTTVNTIRKIYDHVKQVGHYRGIKLTKELPEWGYRVRGQYRGQDMLWRQIMEVLKADPVSPMRAMDVHRRLVAVRRGANKASVMGCLSRLHREGLLEKQNRYYRLARRH